MARYEVRIREVTDPLHFGSRAYEAEVVDTKRHEVIGRGRGSSQSEAEQLAWQRSSSERMKRGD